MEPGSSQTGNPAQRPPQTLGNIIGTLIAFLTLAVPIMAIAHFSPDSRENVALPTELLPSSRH